MSSEFEPQPPKGYRMVPVNEIGLVVPVPNGWHTDKQRTEAGDAPSFFATREDMGNADNKGNYATGLQAILLKNIGKRSRFNSAEELAREYLINPDMILHNPLSEFSLTEKGPLVLASRRFLNKEVHGYVRRKLSEGIVETIRMDPLHIYMLIAANMKTDSAYIVDFTTPQALWDEDSQIAETMLGNLKFNLDF